MNIHWNNAACGAAIIAGLSAGALTVHAGSCCGTSSGCGAAITAVTPVVTATPVPEPLPAVLAGYLKIEAALAKDSLDGVATAAAAISQLPPGKALPATIKTQAEALGKAQDRAAARAAFKTLSTALIRQLEQAKAQTGRYYEVYYGMAKAGWFQDNQAGANPSYGKSMALCGEIKKAF